MLLDRKGVVATIDADEESVTDGCRDVLTRNNRGSKAESWVEQNAFVDPRATCISRYPSLLRRVPNLLQRRSGVARHASKVQFVALQFQIQQTLVLNHTFLDLNDAMVHWEVMRCRFWVDRQAP